MSKLDPPPGAQEESKAATFEQYQAMIQDRPEKFTPEQVGYKPKGGGTENCGRCRHFFSSVERSVCEIVRVGGEESYEDIERDGYCRFQTSDGEDFPRLGDRDRL